VNFPIFNNFLVWISVFKIRNIGHVKTMAPARCCFLQTPRRKNFGNYFQKLFFLTNLLHPQLLTMIESQIGDKNLWYPTVHAISRIYLSCSSFASFFISSSFVHFLCSHLPSTHTPTHEHRHPYLVYYVLYSTIYYMLSIILNNPFYHLTWFNSECGQ
jgi:hypothetical protein